VGITPLFAVEVLEDEALEHLPGFRKRMLWFLENRKDLAKRISYLDRHCPDGFRYGHRLLAIPTREQLVRVLHYVLDPREFLSPFGVRSLSRIHKERPFVFTAGGQEHCVEYVAGESNTGMFGGNSNWRGPIWFPVNYLLVEALERYHHFYGDTLKVECPTGSGRMLNLAEVAREIGHGLIHLFVPDAHGTIPCHGDSPHNTGREAWQDLLLFHEYFNGDTGEGVGADHQTGWTALVASLLFKKHMRQGV
jgi:hypothetical protein